ncbi:putative oxidoreductase C-terminal domain-containing protein [Dyadobacter jiangsuensis]|nr:MAG: oxidoreductase [Dyadobacter sp. 50-39]
MKPILSTVSWLILYALLYRSITPGMAQHKLIVVDPGHFHAALVQKTRYPGVDPVVHVYAEKESDLADYLAKIRSYNSRADFPTNWVEEVYTGANFLDSMRTGKKGDIVVLAGNNKKKISYIKEAMDAGLNVLADKPMVIDPQGFEILKDLFSAPQKKNLLLYDIMTARYGIVNILQRELAQIPGIFGKLENGTPSNPAIINESKHHFFKMVSGKPLLRPTWFFDVLQQGMGIVDVGTHLVDQIQWSGFPNVMLDYQKDIDMISSKISSTPITLAKFRSVTGAGEFPEFLRQAVTDSVLQVYSNGVIDYRLKGVHARVEVRWGFRAPEGEGDTHYSVMRGSKADLVIRQGFEQHFKPVLYIENHQKDTAYEKTLKKHFKAVKDRFPGVELEKTVKGWRVAVPARYFQDHEESFARVVSQYLSFLKERALPDWEIPNMLAKYYILTQAMKNAVKVAPENSEAAADRKE